MVLKKNRKTDDLTKVLESLSGERLQPHRNLSESEKDAIIAKIGPRTVRDIVKAKADFSEARIPFLFSTIDSQSVVDILANDMVGAIARALGGKGPPAKK